MRLLTTYGDAATQAVLLVAGSSLAVITSVTLRLPSSSRSCAPDTPRSRAVRRYRKDSFPTVRGGGSGGRFWIEADGTQANQWHTGQSRRSACAERQHHNYAILNRPFPVTRSREAARCSPELVFTDRNVCSILALDLALTSPNSEEVFDDPLLLTRRMQPCRPHRSARSRHEIRSKVDLKTHKLEDGRPFIHRGTSEEWHKVRRCRQYPT